ncbi:hypothetical protein GF407_19125 [candidate division KSB1 bacterium]|nr:hypothetical protein [candidate division KSB1 bacterium]
MKKVINSEQAPAAIGPYSQAISVTAGRMIFVAGQLGLRASSGEFVSEKIADQTEQALKNLEAILKQAGAEMKHVVKTTVLLSDMENFGTMNKVYARFFPQQPPARAAFQAARLPKDALVEIEAIAVMDENE